MPCSWYHSARAALLLRLDCRQDAQHAYRQALELAGNAAERRFLNQRIRECDEPTTQDGDRAGRR